VYSLVRTILAGAMDDDLIDTNPCHIRGAGQAAAKTPTTILEPAQVQALAQAMPEHLRIGVLLAAWCALRSGEILELRRKDIRPGGELISVARAVTFTYPGPVVHVGEPKTSAGLRTVA